MTSPDLGSAFTACPDDTPKRLQAVRDWIEACFREVGLDWNDYTDTDRTYASPYRRLVSDPAKLLSLGWKPECTFSGLAEMMRAEAARRCEVSEPKADAP